MAVDVSVVIPAYNPGANLDDALSSVFAQTMSHDRFEILVVDDGSTDGTAERLDTLAAQHPGFLSVHHIPASGWPGRPRNVGVEHARGRYVQFLDSDDCLAPAALERLVDLGDSSEADIVIGKLSSDFRGLNHGVFRETVVDRTLLDYPLVDTLTPHKMFRLAFLNAHRIRFAEGPHHVEDEHFCMQAYVHATSVAIVGDLACYFYRRRRTGGRNLGDTAIDPADYFRDLEAVLDVIDAGVAHPAARVPLHRRFYRTETLGRLRGTQMLTYDADYRRDLVERARDVAVRRFSADARASLPVLVRVQSRLLLDADVDGLLDYSRQLDLLRLDATVSSPVWDAGQLRFTIDGRLEYDGKPLRLDRADDGWLIPPSMAPSVGAAERLVSDGDLADADCAVTSRADDQLWSTTAGLAFTTGDDGTIRVGGEVTIDPSTLCGGTALPTGLWDARLRVSVGGITRTTRLRPAASPPAALDAWLYAGEPPLSVTAYWTSPEPALALDVNEWMHALQDLVAARDEPDAVAWQGRRVTITTTAIHGAAGATRAAQLLLVPKEPAMGVVCCDARVAATPEGVQISAQLPRSAAGLDTAELRLRIGVTGSAPPARVHESLFD